MQRHQIGPYEYLTFENLSEISGLNHAIFLKKLDFSQEAAHQKAKELLPLNHLFSGKQCHGKEIAEVTSRFLHQVPCDALMTQERGIGLTIKHADCQATIIYDPIQNALAVVHSGWRGSVQNIYAETILKMKARYGSNPADLLIGISPSLGPNHAEFKHYKTELPDSFWPFQVRPDYFDFWEISRMQLREAGILSHHIEIASICTYAEEADFYSFRRDKTKSRNATIAVLSKRLP